MLSGRQYVFGLRSNHPQYRSHQVSALPRGFYLVIPQYYYRLLSRLTVLTFRSEGELAINIRKATSIEETAPKRKHVRSCIVYTWDHKSSAAFWAGMKVLVPSVSHSHFQYGAFHP